MTLRAVVCPPSLSIVILVLFSSSLPSFCFLPPSLFLNFSLSLYTYDRLIRQRVFVGPAGHITCMPAVESGASALQSQRTTPGTADVFGIFSISSTPRCNMAERASFCCLSSRALPWVPLLHGAPQSVLRVNDLLVAVLASSFGRGRCLSLLVMTIIIYSLQILVALFSWSFFPFFSLLDVVLFNVCWPISRGFNAMLPR